MSDEGRRLPTVENGRRLAYDALGLLSVKEACSKMHERSAVTEFNAMATSGTPSCQQVMRLLERTQGNETDALESHLRKVAGISDDTSRNSNFRWIYSDGEFILARAPNGNYLVHKTSPVTSYADHD